MRSLKSILLRQEVEKNKEFRFNVVFMVQYEEFKGQEISSVDCSVFDLLVCR